MKINVMKKFLYIIFCILIIFSLMSQSYAAFNFTLTENAWEQLTPEMIQQALDEGDESSIINAINLLGSSGMVSFVGNSVDLAQKYLDLTDVLYNNLSTGKVPLDIWNASGAAANVDAYRRDANAIIESNPTDNGNNDNNDNNSNNKTWKDYSLNEYDTESVGALWLLLKPVDTSSLSSEDLDKYIQCIEKVYNRRTEVDSTMAAEITQRREELYDYSEENYGDKLEGTKAESIIQGFGDTPEYVNPLFNQGGNYGTAKNVTPDTIISDADAFMDTGASSDVATINQTNANTVLDSIYNILLAIGITVTVIWGLIIAIKLMMSSVEEKAEYKKLLAPYLVGCVVIFGSFIIWKIVIVVMNNVM